MDSLLLYTPPWRQPPLDEWDITFMRHVKQDGKRALTVTVEKEGKYVTVTGPDNNDLWVKVWDEARRVECASQTK